jgi:hypothetical protein
MEKNKVKEQKFEDFSIEERRKMITEQLKSALAEREKYSTMVFKCQGALEALDGLKND